MISCDLVTTLDNYNKRDIKAQVQVRLPHFIVARHTCC